MKTKKTRVDLTEDEIQLMRVLNASPHGRTISGNKRHAGLDALVRKGLATASAVSLSSVLYEITELERKTLAKLGSS